MKTSCLEAESGLYHEGHLRSVLAQELARLDRGERSLCLALIEARGLSGPAWSLLGRLLRQSLRRIDLAARLEENLAAVVMPDADEHRARRWLLELAAEAEKGGLGRDLTYGLAFARPWEGRTVDELLRLALENMGGRPFENMEEGEDFALSPVTAIAADERNLLFAGFAELGRA